MLCPMFEHGDTVSVTVGWLSVPQGAKGEVLGVAFHDPIACLVRFPTGLHAIPVVHLELARSTQQQLARTY